ncbi:hypothetical protein C0Q70_12643 [Pomacea canaliculata]|uniref:Uncharacterized protein n=1 Tax=Pomacea canaliculata TaxID=400727 RepID=A0A2T7P234_POMCA|nr:hypothetical protein C0Q70_12643 [Pomacea canaliculata]
MLFNYRDFDLEAEIATLPPCSLDQVSRRRLIRRCSESESTKRPACPSSPRAQPHPQSTKSEPLIGSQKRKARKRSISRLLPISCDSSGTAFSHSLSTQIPLVRDATAAPCETERALAAMVTSRSQPVLTASRKDSSVKILRQASGSELMPQKPVVCQDSDTSALYLGEENDHKAWYMETSGSKVSESSGGRLKQGRKVERINENKQNPEDWPERADGWVNEVKVREGKQDSEDDKFLAKSTQQETEGLGILPENMQQEQEAEGKTAAKFRSTATVCGLNTDMDCVQYASHLHMCASAHGDLDKSTDNSVCDELNGTSKSFQESEISDISHVCGFEREGLSWRPQPVSNELEPRSSGEQRFSHIVEDRDSLDSTADGVLVKYQSDISGSNQVKLSWHTKNVDSLELVRSYDFPDEKSVGGSGLVLPLSGTGSVGITAARANAVGKLDFCNQSADGGCTHVEIAERDCNTSANEESDKMGGRWL